MLHDIGHAGVALMLAAALAAGGCRCESGQPADKAGGEAGQAQAGAIGDRAAGGGDVARWCMACAQKGYMACKRADGKKPEADLKREAELLACKDVGIAEAGCTAEVLSNVSCGVMP